MTVYALMQALIVPTLMIKCLLFLRKWTHRIEQKQKFARNFDFQQSARERLVEHIFLLFLCTFSRIIETQSENRVNVINDTVCRNSVWKEQNILKIIFFISTTLLTGWVILGVLIKKYVLFIKSRSVLAFDCWRIWHLSWTVWNIYACQICRIFLANIF